MSIFTKNGKRQVVELPISAIQPNPNQPRRYFDPDALNELGHTVRACIEQIPFHYDCATVEKYVVMPNHVHMLILLTGENCPALSTIIGSYKSNVSKQIHLINPAVRVWQRSFHDHIVRNENTLERIWKYIDENPYHWNEDKFFVNDL